MGVGGNSAWNEDARDDPRAGALFPRPLAGAGEYY